MRQVKVTKRSDNNFDVKILLNDEKDVSDLDEAMKKQHDHTLLYQKPQKRYQDKLTVVFYPVDTSESVDDFKWLLEQNNIHPVEVRRVTNAKGDILRHMEVYFATSEVAKVLCEKRKVKVKMGFQRLSFGVRRRPPMRCFKCQGLGHTARGCKRTRLCYVCGQQSHTDVGQRCDNPRRCAGCGSDSHLPGHFSCPRVKELTEGKTNVEPSVGVRRTRNGREINRTVEASYCYCYRNLLRRPSPLMKN